MSDLFGTVQPPRPAAAFVPVPAPTDAPVVVNGQRLCVVCGAPAFFGHGAFLRRGIAGRWTCGAHREAAQ